MPHPHRTPSPAAGPDAKTAWAIRVRGEATESLEIDILDDIAAPGWFSDGAASVKSVRNALKASPNAKAITVRINSAGGEVTEGLGMYALLAEHPAKVTVRIDAMAASIASIVAMAGDEIVMAEGAFMMIHNPLTVAIGDAREMRRTADLLDKMQSTLVDVYERRTGQERAAIAAALDAETWMTATEAQALGYATAVVPMKGKATEAPSARIWNLADFSRVPDAVKAAQRMNKIRATNAAEGEPMDPKKMYDELLAALGLKPDATHEEALAAAKKAAGEEEPPPPPAEEGEKSKDPPPPPAEEAAKAALGRKVARLTGQSDPDAALGTIEGWKASHARAEVERAEQAKKDKAAEAVRRDAAVVALVKAGEPIASAWADPLKATDTKARVPAEPWASMPIAQLEARVAAMGALPAAMRPAGAPGASTPASGPVATSTDAAIAAKYGVKPESAAWARDEMARAQTRAVGG